METVKPMKAIDWVSSLSLVGMALAMILLVGKALGWSVLLLWGAVIGITLRVIFVLGRSLWKRSRTQKFDESGVR